MRRICAGVSVGNTCSTRELLSGSPRLTWLIVVFGGAAALPDYLSLFGRDPAQGAKYKMYSHPRYGLRFGFASATGNFQRLGGRPPLVSPLKSCMGRSFTGGNTGSNPVGDGPAFEAVPRVFRRTGSFERVETPPRLKRLLRKKVGTETTRRRITAAAMPPHSMGGQSFCCPHFLPAVAVCTRNYQQLLAPPVPRSRCNDCFS